MMIARGRDQAVPGQVSTAPVAGEPHKELGCEMKPRKSLDPRRLRSGLCSVLVAFASESLAVSVPPPTISEIVLNPVPLVVGSPFTITVNGADIASGAVVVDFRPSVARMMRLPLAESGGFWSVAGDLPDGLGISAPTPIRITAYVFNSAGVRASTVTQATVIPAPPVVALTVRGQVLFTDRSPVIGAQINGRLAPEAPGASSEVGDSQFTDGEGRFVLQLEAPALPARVVAEVHYQEGFLPAIDTAKWGTAEASDVDLGVVTLPQAAQAEMTIVADTASSPDGTVTVANLPPEVDRLFAQSFDPDASPEAFPGEFAEEGGISLNSTVFLWMEALDAAGNPVSDLSLAITVRVLIPRSQWPDLSDVEPGTDRVEIPIYSFSETTSQWVREGLGWLEDGNGAWVPEAAEPQILDGTFPGDLYAVMTRTHLSWVNVDYPYIGPWPLWGGDVTSVPHCLPPAMELATAIVRSDFGKAALMKYNLEGADVDLELADARGPRVIPVDLASDYAAFLGNERADRDDRIYLNERLWSVCGSGGSPDQEANETLLIAVSLLHVTAQWKWDTKHEGGIWIAREPGGEAGHELEKDLFGGVITGDANGLFLDGVSVAGATRDQWLAPAYWGALAPPSPPPDPPASPLEITISLAKAEYELGEDIPVTVEYRNIGAIPVRVLRRDVLEGYPLSFLVIRDANVDRVPFRGSRVKRAIDSTADFVTLNPGDSSTAVVQLLHDPATGALRYEMTAPGTYTITALYSPHFGLPEAASASLTIRLTGAVESVLHGRVSGSQHGYGIPFASVHLVKDGVDFSTTETDADGNYQFSSLPGGAYELALSVLGYDPYRLSNIVLVEGSVIREDVTLMHRDIQVVIESHGYFAGDTDAHLWLPEGVPYHIAYFRRGNRYTCPYAQWEPDDFDPGFGGWGNTACGREIVTISQRFPGRYVFAVHLPQDPPWAVGPASTLAGSEVRVYISNRQPYEYPLAPNRTDFVAPAEGGDGMVWWEVFALDGLSGRVTELNRLSATSPAPYGDSGQGCPDWPMNLTLHDESVSTPIEYVGTDPCPDGGRHEDATSWCVGPCAFRPHDGAASRYEELYVGKNWVHSPETSHCGDPDWWVEGYMHDSVYTKLHFIDCAYASSGFEVHDYCTTGCTCFPHKTYNSDSHRCECDPGWIHVQESSQCWEKCPAPQYHEEWSSACRCEAPFTHDPTTSDCVECPDGFMHDFTISECIAACPGEYHVAGDSSCQPCPEGFVHASGTSACCPVGAEYHEPDTTACAPCEWYVSVHLPDTSICCPPGEENHDPGTSECRFCPAGQVHEEPTSTCCLPGETFDNGVCREPWVGNSSVTGSLNQGRWRHSATLLPDGRVLVAGGGESDAVYGVAGLRSVEIYDPVTGIWTLAEDMTEGRTAHTATLGSATSVLVAGGRNGPPQDAEVFDISSGTWALVPWSGRALHTATRLPAGSVLVVGGEAGHETLSDCEEYDGFWTYRQPMGVPRAGHTATLLPDGRVLIVGGYNWTWDDEGSAIVTYLRSAEMYDPAIDEWSAAGSLWAARAQHTATLLLDGRVLVIGGQDATETHSSAEIYDPGTGVWRWVTRMNLARSRHSATCLPSGQVLVAGGAEGAELYSPASGKWSVPGAMMEIRCGHTATLLPDGRVLLVGGDASGSTAEIYEP